METLKFKVNKSELRRKDKKVIANASQDTVYAEIKFKKNSEWDNIQKFAVFENDDRKKTTVELGTETDCKIKIPPLAMTGYYFILSIFGGDFLTTNAIRVGLNYSHIKKDSIFDDDSGYVKNIIIDIYQELNKKYDNIELTDGKFICYINNEPVKILDVDSLIISKVQSYLDDNIEYNDYKFENNQLQCLINGEIKRIIPLDIILKNYYTKKEIDESLSRTLVDVQLEDRQDGIYLILDTFGDKT